MKKTIVYGIEMSFIEEMKFFKFLSNEGIAMNTKTKEERQQIAKGWLHKNIQ